MAGESKGLKSKEILHPHIILHVFPEIIVCDFLFKDGRANNFDEKAVPVCG